MFNFFKRSQKSTEQRAVTPKDIFTLFDKINSEAGVSVTRDTALSVPAFWQGVNFIASTLASLPLHVVQETNGERRRLNNQVSKLLNVAPIDNMTAYKWRHKMITDVLTEGRHFTYIQRARNNQPANLWPLDPRSVTVETVSGVIQYIYTPGDERSKVDAQRFTADQIIDIPWHLDPDGITHYSPVHLLRDTLGLSSAMTLYAARFFKNGGIPPAAVETDTNPSPAAAKRGGEDLKKTLENAIKEGRLPYLPAGHKITSLGVEPEKSQLEQSRRFQVEEIARVLDLPPVFLHDLTHGTFNNTEQAALNLTKYTLRKWEVNIEQELNLKIFGRSNETRFIQHNNDDLLRGDFETRMNGLAQGVQNAILTPNEARASENRQSLEGGDSLHIQQNMSQLENVGNAASNSE